MQHGKARIQFDSETFYFGQGLAEFIGHQPVSGAAVPLLAAISPTIRSALAYTITPSSTCTRYPE
jgi:hypothetical protein